VTGLALCLAVALLFTAIGALVLTGGRERPAGLAARPGGRPALRATACGLLAAALWLLCVRPGAEVGLPLFLGLLSLAGLGNLLLAALSRRWHRTATLASAAAALIGAGLLAASS